MPIRPWSRGSKIRGKIHGPAKRPGRTPSLQAMALAQKDQLLEIGSRVAVRLTHHMREIERLPRQTRAFIAQPAARMNLSGIALRLRSSNKSSLHDVMQNRRRPFGLPQTCFQVDEWWSRTGSNRRPPACKAGALPAELRPLIVQPQAPSGATAGRPCGCFASDRRNPATLAAEHGGPGRT